MLAEQLFHRLDAILFQDIPFDSILDLREDKAFDTEWMRIYEAIEKRKEKHPLSSLEQEQVKAMRKAVYLKVYELSQNSDISAYLSDDFGLLLESEYLGYSDPWLSKLQKEYEAAKIPCGIF